MLSRLLRDLLITAGRAAGLLLAAIIVYWFIGRYGG